MPPVFLTGLKPPFKSACINQAFQGRCLALLRRHYSLGQKTNLARPVSKLDAPPKKSCQFKKLRQMPAYPNNCKRQDALQFDGLDLEVLVCLWWAKRTLLTVLGLKKLQSKNRQLLCKPR